MKPKHYLMPNLICLARTLYTYTNQIHPFSIYYYLMFITTHKQSLNTL